MSTELIINASLPETRIALLEDGEIQELLIERASGKGIVGNIYKGRVTRVLPGMQAAFVDIGLEKAAFLYVDDVYVHSEIWERQEAKAEGDEGDSGTDGGEADEVIGAITPVVRPLSAGANEPAKASGEAIAPREEGDADDFVPGEPEELDDLADVEEDDGEDDEDDGEGEPQRMSPPPGDDDEGGGGNDQPSGTVSPPSEGQGTGEGQSGSEEGQGASAPGGERDSRGPGSVAGGTDADRKRRRGRRGGRNRKRTDGDVRPAGEGRLPTPIGSPISANPTAGNGEEPGDYPDSYADHVSESGDVESDRTELATGQEAGGDGESNRPEAAPGAGGTARVVVGTGRAEFKESRDRSRKIRPRSSSRPPRPTVSIQDLLKEGQEVIVQVAKDPISTKGARLTCHISLPGRHLVCMPTIDHVGVSRRIERDDERRKLREYVEKYRPKNLGFIVRTASGRQQAEKRIEQDIQYLTNLWEEIREKAAHVTAPALVYEDLNSVLRAVRDWVTEDIDAIRVDSRYHFNDLQKFASHFMPSLKPKIELYQGDLPIFDAYNISTELSRALEQKVWLKSGGYIVVDQAEALVAIDVNTGRYVGKKNLEDTILKTNLEAVQEIAYQLRLRNCGGIIILDLIDMEREENKQRVYRALEEALKKDRARPTILKISELGLVEMTRKRTRDTLVRALCESCPHCEGKGFIKNKQTVAYEILREIEREGVDQNVNKILIRGHSDVIDSLAIDERETLDQLERRFRKQVYLQAVGDYHPEQYEVIGEQRDGVTKTREGRIPRVEERGGRDRNRSGGRDRGRGRSSGGGGGRDQGRDQNRDETPAAAGNGTVIVVPKSAGSENRPAEGERDGLQDSARRGRRGRRGGRDRGPRDQQPRASGSLPKPLDTPIQANPANMPTAGQPFSVQGDNYPDNPTGEPTGYLGPKPHAGGAFDGFDNDEDRLAYVRAQATQDAALANPGANANRGNAWGGRPRGGQGGDRFGGRGPGGPVGPAGPGGAGGPNARRGRRGGRGRDRFGQGANRPQFGGAPAAGGPGNGYPADVEQDGGGSRPEPVTTTAPTPKPTTGGGEGSGSGGGGGDYGNPPQT